MHTIVTHPGGSHKDDLLAVCVLASLHGCPIVRREPTAAELDATRWDLPPVFRWLAKTGRITEHEMLRTFNCGIGMIVVVEASKADAVAKVLTAAGEKVVHLGEVVAAKGRARVAYSGHLDLGGWPVVPGGDG